MTLATSIDVGAIATTVIQVSAAILIPSVGALILAGLQRLFKKLGVQLNQENSDRLQSMVVNGLNAGAAEAEARTANLQPIEIKNQAVASTVDYVKAHGADTLKALGFDPANPQAQASLAEAIKARVETAINDPQTPTPPVITPADVKAAAPLIVGK
jgi:hypothetical protein